MFDQTALINYFLTKIKTSTHQSNYFLSAYNQSLDRRLHQLVVKYIFNFQAIALHLSYEFPQFQYKITKQSIAFRWYQLQAQDRQNRQKQSLINLQPPPKIKTPSHPTTISHLHPPSKKYLISQQIQSQQSQDSQQLISHQQSNIPTISTTLTKINNNHDSKLQELEKVLISAGTTSTNQQQGFIMYKPIYEKYNQGNQPLIKQQKDHSNIISSQQLLPQANQIQQSFPQQQEKREKMHDSYQYGYNYSQLQQQYNNYNNLINNYGFGYHDDSATSSSDGSQEKQHLEDVQIFNINLQNESGKIDLSNQYEKYITNNQQNQGTKINKAEQDISDDKYS